NFGRALRAVYPRESCFAAGLADPGADERRERVEQNLAFGLTAAGSASHTAGHGLSEAEAHRDSAEDLQQHEWREHVGEVVIDGSGSEVGEQFADFCLLAAHVSDSRGV